MLKFRLLAAWLARACSRGRWQSEVILEGRTKAQNPNKGSNQLQIKIPEPRKEAGLILQSGIYIFFVTNISEGTGFLLQGLVYKKIPACISEQTRDFNVCR